MKPDGDNDSGTKEPPIPPHVNMRISLMGSDPSDHACKTGVVKRVIGNLGPNGEMMVLVKFDNEEKLEPVLYKDCKVLEVDPKFSDLFNAPMPEHMVELGKMMLELVRRRENILTAILYYNVLAIPIGQECLSVDFSMGKRSDGSVSRILINEIEMPPKLPDEDQALLKGDSCFSRQCPCNPRPVESAKQNEERSLFVKGENGEYRWNLDLNPGDLDLPPEDQK